MRRDLLEAFAAKLSPDDIVVIEATENAMSAAAGIGPHVEKVIITPRSRLTRSTPACWRYASGFLPEVWIPDEPTQALRRQVTRRNQIVRQRSRLKNIIQSILHIAT
ncbi:transposase [Aminobacter aminovorans]|nr:transposase [Aminobacter aminovorans]